MISKELLSEVLKDYTIGTYLYINDTFEYIQYINNFGVNKKINIYELAHKCKEWALNKDYKLLSMSKECFLYDIVELYDVSEQLEQWIEWFEADTETEAIFKACQWILDNKKEGN